MKVIVIRPGRAPNVAEFDRSVLETLNQLVAGPPEKVRIGDTGLMAIVNRDGRLRDLQPAGCLRICPIQDDILHGPIFIFRDVAGTLAGVKTEDFVLIQKIFVPVLKGC